MKLNIKATLLSVATCGLIVASFPLLGKCYKPFTDPEITRVITTQAPAAIGPYSQATRAGNQIFVSGQIGVDPTTSQLAGPSIEEQTKQALNNVEAILATQGLSLENVVRVEVYLTDLADFTNMNTVYGHRFTYDVKPARTTVQVSKLPRDARIEITCLAYIPEALR